MSWDKEKQDKAWDVAMAEWDAYFELGKAWLASTPTYVGRGRARGGATVILGEFDYFGFGEDLGWADKEVKVKKKARTVELNWVELKGFNEG